MTESREPTVQELFDLTGRSALITGGAGWLGSSLARALAEAGASVVVSSRDLGRARETAASLPSPGGAEHFGVELDHMEPDSMSAGFRDAVGVAGKLDVLVNNGVEWHSEGIADETFEGFSRHMANNAGYFVLARLLRDHAVERAVPASIVMIGSMYGVVGSYPDAYEGLDFRSPVAYHALKGGTVHLTRHLAVYWAKDNVRVNCLSPGAFPKDQVIEEVIERLSAKAPMKRLGRPHELKGALLLLASDAGSYMTGTNILVEGGWTSW
jgi:gluconate 5-dehydrogenase